MSILHFSSRVADAITQRQPVVALESSVLAQGLPIPANAEAARRMTAAVERVGAVPAISAVSSGRAVFGLDEPDLARFLARDGVMKVSARDIPVAMVQGRDGATTVAGTLSLMALSPISVFATGGIGGVHREPAFDESADLAELARTPVIVVCAGAKSILDLAATMERLETHGVVVIGYRTHELPGFFYADTGIPLSTTVSEADEIAQLYATHRALGRQQAIVVMQQPPTAHAVRKATIERALDAALDDAKRHGVRGSAVTPYLLTAVERATEGRTLAANLALLEANAALAGEIAVACARQASPRVTTA
ncbi:MAG TPA: pseudouridine-5'-phosphate glycosidase [Gemmatimonadaceae bacterium]|nr:pseudouridine-5'-phosphate glycosidase [Gemmatimonadaceae bacterium]